MKVPVELEILEKYMPESELSAVLESVRITRKNYMTGYRKRVRITRKNYKSDVRITDSENCEIGSKTAFSAENAANFALVRGGGVRGGGVQDPYVTVPYIKINSIQEEKLKINKEEKISEIKENEKKQYWKKIEKLARPYWTLMPSECRNKSTFKQFVFVFNKLRKGADVPEVWAFFGMLRVIGRAWNEGYLPKAHEFLGNEPWRNFGKKEITEIARSKETLQSEADKIIAEFDGMGGRQ